MLSAHIARLQPFVADPIMTVAGSAVQAAEVFDVTILSWLLLGVDMSWERGVVTESSHVWAGAAFHSEGVNAIMEITPQFKSITKKIRRNWKKYLRNLILQNIKK